jgi:hypothetical protein
MRELIQGQEKTWNFKMGVDNHGPQQAHAACVHKQHAKLKGQMGSPGKGTENEGQDEATFSHNSTLMYA